LGKGGFGHVYKAKFNSLVVAVKVKIFSKTYINKKVMKIKHLKSNALDSFLKEVDVIS